MTAADRLNETRGPVAVETTDIIMGGETVTVDVRRARSYISRGLAEAAQDVKTTSQSSEPISGPTAQEEPTDDQQVGSLDAQDAYSGLTRDELAALAKERGLPVSGNKTELIDRLSLADADSSVEDEASAGDEPLSGSDSNAD